MKKDFYFTNSRFKFIAAVLVFIFLVFMLLFYLKGEEITNDPCSICAKKLGEDVTCFSGFGMNQKQIIYEADFNSLEKKPTTEITNLAPESSIELQGGID